MSISDISKMRLAYIAEDTYGVQKTGSNLQTMRITGESLKATNETIRSNEIRDDRQTAAIVRSDIGAGGPINFELSYGSFDDFLLAALMASAWSSPVAVLAAGTASAVNSTNSFTHASAWDNTPTAGEWIEVRGFANAANNGYFKVVSATGTSIVVSGGTLTDETDKTGVDIDQGASITNGSTKTSFNIEREYTDLTNNFALFLGCMVNQLSLNVGVKAIVTGSIDILSKVESSETSSGGSGYDAVNSNKILNSIDDVVGIYENEISVNVLDFSLTLNNALRERKKIGTLGTFDIGLSTLQLSGSFNAYYESSTLYDKFIDFTTTSLAKVFDDNSGDGNAYVIDIPSVKITDGGRDSSAGKDNDFMVPCTWEAFRDATEGITIRIVKFAA